MVNSAKVYYGEGIYFVSYNYVYLWVDGIGKTPNEDQRVQVDQLEGQLNTLINSVRLPT